MKLKKELRAVKEINEQARREREEQDRMKQQQQQQQQDGGKSNKMDHHAPLHHHHDSLKLSSGTTGLGLAVDKSQADLLKAVSKVPT